ncbi:MAG: site-specific DNA-methyltransferase [Mycoplasmataceae bacterium]|nr:site-specific DNA-methyltransferase [Mycoplasmataceae bacterium]
MLILGDSLVELKKIKSNSIDLVFSDPPYFLSNDGISCQNGKMVSVNKGEWDKSQGFKENVKFHKQWIKECKRILKPNGTIAISGTYHSIYQCGFILQEQGFEIINDIVWFKPNGAPCLACKNFTASHESVIWARKTKKSKHTFNYEVMKNWDVSNDKINNQGKQMRSVWSIGLTPANEKKFGKHPTQKPNELLKRIIAAATNEGDTILDPFMGSGTTGVVAKMLKRKFIGIEMSPEYVELAKKRIENVNE